MESIQKIIQDRIKELNSIKREDKPLPVISDQVLLGLVNDFKTAGDHLFRFMDEPFIFTPENSGLIIELLKYFSWHQSIFNPKKGILLTGDIGRGKTSIFRIINLLLKTNEKYPEIICEELGIDYRKRGDEVFEPLKRKTLFDDMLREKPEYKHYAEPINVMQHVIDNIAYKQWQLNGLKYLFTMNGDKQKAIERYGDRTQQCLWHMSNVIEIVDNKNWRLAA